MTRLITLIATRVVLVILSGAFIAFGFAIDGISEVGHHVGLILGGGGLGYAFARTAE